MMIKYIRESYDELLHKVSWPSANELQNSAVVVLTASLLIALLVWVMDKSFSNILSTLIYQAKI